VLTETDDVARAIDRAAELYPGESRASVLRRLIELGAEAVAQRAAARREHVRRHAGRHPGVFEPNELETLREDWPE
jgi:hypothetical protein